MSAPKVWLGDDGIIRSEYKPGARISLEDMKSEFELRLAISKEKHPLIILLHGIREFRYEAQNFLAGDKNCVITSAIAIVIPEKNNYPVLSQFLIKTFVAINRLPFSVKIFNNESDAVKWIKQYL